MAHYHEEKSNSSNTRADKDLHYLMNGSKEERDARANSNVLANPPTERIESKVVSSEVK